MAQKLPFAAVFLCVILLLASCANNASQTENNLSGSGESPVSETQTLPDVAENGSEQTDSGFGITDANGVSVQPEGSVYIIKTAGEYTVTGTLENGQIAVDAGDEDEVKLVLNGASLSCDFGPPILILNANEANVHAAEGTENTVTDARASVDTADADTENYDAAIYAACDLKLTGAGTLTVSSAAGNGVKTKDDLKIKNLTLKVTAAGNALKGNDSVTVESGSLVLVSEEEDGIKTSNSDISSKGNQRGTVLISGGTVDIYAACDGIDAAYDVQITEGESGAPNVNIYTANCAEEAAAAADGAFTVRVPTGDASAKGVKAANEIVITAGTLTVRSTDDALHVNGGDALENGAAGLGNITVGGGNLSIVSADDGMHADGVLNIGGGEINVAGSHEGLEANVINISGGRIYVAADDDGVNASKGSETPLVNVTGGYLEITTPSGDTDGIDSNGNISVSGGFVLVKCGASMGGMAGSVDADGTVSVTGGTVVALGGVCETPGSGSVCTYISSGTAFSAGDYELKDGSGNTLFTFSLASAYTSVWLSSDAFATGGEYTLYRDGDVLLQWTQSSSTVGSAGGMGPGGMGPGGMGPGGMGRWG